MTLEHPSYAHAWQDFRIKRRRYRISQVALILLALSFSITPSGGTRSLMGLALLAAIAKTFVTSSGALYWRCPRCHEQFFVKRGRWTHNLNIFARQCMHCGLPKWANRDLEGPRN